MWCPLVISSDNISAETFNLLFEGKIPAIIIPKFYSKTECNEIIKQIKLVLPKDHTSNLLGPFLMSYTTDKKNYFSKSEQIIPIFEKIFSKNENPNKKISNFFKNIFPCHLISIASENDKKYSPYIFRIHKKGHSIPLHKDNVKYEGIEYAVSKISKQFSCVIHLQESEIGGNLVIFKKRWEKKDEKFRNIDFGYSKKISLNSEKCVIERIETGDLVIINPNFYHEVTTIEGDLERITIGMFVGLLDNSKRIVCWA